MAKFIMVTGGVASSLGKGTFCASIGMLLKEHGYKVTIEKFDPYLCIDPGNLSIKEHGEVFILHDGARCDLDLGHYERFIDEELPNEAETTSGMIYQHVIDKERRGDYLGKTVQIIPHVTNEIKQRIYNAAKKTDADIVITEIGGTVGDIEGLPYLEAIRQVKKEVGDNDVIYVHLTLLPFLSSSSELKTKPTQHSVKELRGIGIQPDILICRTQQDISSAMKEKIAMFCDVDVEAIIENKTVRSVYEVPISLNNQNLDKVILNKLKLPMTPINLESWNQMLYRVYNPKRTVKVGLVGRYANCADAYLSVIEALKHAGSAQSVAIEIEQINPADITEGKVLSCQGLIMAGPNDDSVSDSEMNAVALMRNSRIPFLGIGFGFCAAAMEFGRNQCSLSPRSIILHDNKAKIGTYACKTTTGRNNTSKAYGQNILVFERQFRNCEFARNCSNDFEKNGMLITATSPDFKTVEIIELMDHPFFVATMAHPEFSSRPNRPHQLFTVFVRAMTGDE